MSFDSRPNRYFAIQYTIFRILGVGWWHHPDEDDTRNFPGWYLYYAIFTQLFFVIGFVALETTDPFVGEKDMDRFMFGISFVITHDLTCLKLFIFYFRNKQIQEIVRTLEIELYNYYQNNRRNNLTLRITRIATASYVFFGWITILNASIYGIIQDSRWKEEIEALNDTSSKPLRTLPQPVWIPWDYQNDDKSYAAAFFLEIFGLIWTGHIVLTVDTFIGSIILHMSSQFVILREAFETAYDRTISRFHKKSRQKIQESNVENHEEITHDEDSTEIDREATVKAEYSEEEIESALEATLKNCIQQHQVLVSCVKKFAETYSYGFMTQLLSSTGAICVVMVQLSEDASSFKSMRMATSIAFFMAMIIQLALQCFTGNELTLQAEGVADAVMECKWERMSPRLRRMLALTMMRAQRPLRLSAAGFAYMNNDSFIAILKAAYSYYAVLSQKND